MREVVWKEAKCPNCSAPMDTHGGVVTCRYCGSEFSRGTRKGQLPDISRLFRSGLFSECVSLATERLQESENDIEAMFYRGLARLFQMSDDYLRFDRIILNIYENTLTPVGMEKLIHADITRSISIDKVYEGLLKKHISCRMNERPRYSSYRKDIEERVRQHLAR